MLVYGKYECFVMQMLYVCVHPVAVLNAAFCMTCSLLMLVVVVCLPRPMEGMGRLQFSDLFTELTVPLQAAEVVGTC